MIDWTINVWHAGHGQWSFAAGTVSGVGCISRAQAQHEAETLVKKAKRRIKRRRSVAPKLTECPLPNKPHIVFDTDVNRWVVRTHGRQFVKAALTHVAKLNAQLAKAVRRG
ncbi:hypothetical protein XccvBFoX4_gp82 [Xanthomonas phage FoX4]|uniref:Uncharacterized protein n=1 Tax=Xanthomonas phage FoX4 TaxID=2723900 RepID=A0A858XBI8_9CAUD|nr:hypothetical protein KNU97_gp82 [Xanthomonas phage FoX4]QJI53036.1 hypothetical protein XccvBFoX4_gp82 [Xanthomonas phage FoX4]